MSRAKTIADQIREINARREAGQAGQAPAKGIPMPAGPAATATRPATPDRNSRIWPDGKRHSITYGQHLKNVKAKSAARNDANPLYDPTKQLSGDALRQAAGDLVDLEFGSQRSALTRELANTTTQGQAVADRAAGYSQQMAGVDAGLVPQIDAIQQLLGQRLGANADAAKTSVGEGADAAHARAAEDASVSGFNIPGLATAGVDAEAQKQIGRLAELGKSNADAGAAQTANYSGLAAISAAARRQMGNEVQGELLNRLANAQADVRGRQADVAAQEGPALTAKIGELRQQGFENLVTQKGLGIKTKELEAETAQAQAKLAEQQKNRRQIARDKRAERALRRELDASAKAGKLDETNQLGYTNREWQNMTTKQRQAAIRDYNRNKTKDTTRPSSGSGKNGGMSANAFSKRTRIDSIITDIGTDPKLKRHQYETGPRLVQILVNRGADPLEAQAAAEIARHGVLTPATAEKLRRAGIHIPQSWLGTPPTGRDAQPG